MINTDVINVPIAVHIEAASIITEISLIDKSIAASKTLDNTVCPYIDNK